MARTEELTVPGEENGLRLDKFISVKLPNITRTAAEKLAESGQVCLRGKALPKSYKVQDRKSVV